jgi:hypothetical protein
LVSHFKGEAQAVMFENRNLRKIFGPKREKVIGEWRKFHYEELQNLYSSKNIILCEQIEENEMGWSCGTYGGEERCVRCFVGQP